MHQAVFWHDHARISEFVNSGRHPLTIIEQCIEMRGDAIDTLMLYVPRDCPVSVEAVGRVVTHLQMIARYPHALEVLERWLASSPTIEK